MALSSILPARSASSPVNTPAMSLPSTRDFTHISAIFTSLPLFMIHVLSQSQHVKGLFEVENGLIEEQLVFVVEAEGLPVVFFLVELSRDGIESRILRAFTLLLTWQTALRPNIFRILAFRCGKRVIIHSLSVFMCLVCDITHTCINIIMYKS